MLVLCLNRWKFMVVFFKCVYTERIYCESIKSSAAHTFATIFRNSFLIFYSYHICLNTPNQIISRDSMRGKVNP